MHPGIAEEVHLTKHSCLTGPLQKQAPKTTRGLSSFLGPYSWSYPPAILGQPKRATMHLQQHESHGANHKGRKELRWAAERHLASKGHWHRRPKPYQHGICWMHMFRIFLMVRSVAGQLQRLTKELCCQGALLLVAGGDKYGAAGENLS